MSGSISRREYVTGAGLAAAALALGSGVSEAQGSSADDLIRLVKGAAVYDLSFTWNEQAPVLGLNPPYSFALNRTHRLTH
jgi:hypothetical protein